MRADATIPIMSARAQVSYLRDEKNVSFELMGEEDAVAFLEERSFFFKLKAFAKDFEKYSCKPGEKGRYVNLDFGHLVELSKLDKALRSLVLDLALDIEHYLKVRINVLRPMRNRPLGTAVDNLDLVPKSPAPDPSSTARKLLHHAQSKMSAAVPT